MVIVELPSTPKKDVEKKPKNKVSKTFIFTLNNYTDSDIEELIKMKYVSKGVFGKEIGEECGTPHLQGAVTFIKSFRCNEVSKMIPGAHIEVAKAKDVMAPFRYCLKDQDFTWWKTDVDLLRYDQLYDWQLKIVELVKTKPDKRTIHWYWEKTGCTGKTELVKYLCYKHDALLFGGRAGDITSRVIQHGAPRIAVMNLTRTTEGRISWQAIESLKDGCVETGKYEGGQLVFNPPHVIIFANFEPERGTLSADRWNIVNIGNQNEFGFM